jgi:hypothetical protein
MQPAEGQQQQRPFSAARLDSLFAAAKLGSAVAKAPTPQQLQQLQLLEHLLHLFQKFC